MRMYQSLFKAVRETERELWEMAIEVQPQSMQDKIIANDPNYLTKEIRGYAFKMSNWQWNADEVRHVLEYFYKEKACDIFTYILAEFRERVSGQAHNPGRAYLYRQELWDEFLHNGKFAYTYSERIAPQLKVILQELKKHPETRQAILNVHSNICPIRYLDLKVNNEQQVVCQSDDLQNIGGAGRAPCSMYYQVMVREKKVDLIYCMRSCDFLTHFSVDISLALLLQDWFADKLKLATGTFTWFCGSLHAYQKDLKERGIF